MNLGEFKYNVFAAGHGDHWDEIVSMVDKANDRTPVYIDDLRDAAYRYLCVTMDYEKLFGFLIECNKLTISHCISWDEAVKLLCHIIAIWGK